MSEELNQETPAAQTSCEAIEKKANTNLIISIALGIAVIVLFILHFTGGKSNTPAITAASTTVNGKIAFVNADTIIKQYAMAKEIKIQLEDKVKKVQAELTTRQQSFQKRVTDFQQKMQAKSISQEQAQK